MSKYLDFGIAREITASMRREYHTYTSKEIIDDFFKTVDRKLYDVSIIEEKYIIFNLKDEKLLKYGIDLIKEQYEKYIRTNNIEEILEGLNNLNNKTDEEKLRIINNESSYYLQDIRMGWYGFDANAFFDLPIEAYITDFLTYHDSNKTFMEEYNEFLKYVRNLLIKSTDNPLKTALAVSI